MTLEGITTIATLEEELQKLDELLATKTKENNVYISLSPRRRAEVTVIGERGIVGVHGCHYGRGDTVADAINAARKYIASMPDIEHRATVKYQQGLATVIEEAKENGVDDNLLEGARESLLATSRNLLAYTPQETE